MTQFLRNDARFNDSSAIFKRSGKGFANHNRSGCDWRGKLPHGKDAFDKPASGLTGARALTDREHPDHLKAMKASAEECRMPIYQLDDRIPELPEAGSFWIAPDAHVIGKVRLGRDVSIWFNAVLRGDNELIDLREGTNIQDGCMLHTDMGFPMVVGPFATVGHHAILHGCTVGENSLIGMGATVLNGAKIGKNSLVGANALVPEGKEFPDNALIVGTPARVVRLLDDVGAARLRATAEGYMRNWKRFARGLTRLPEPGSA
jgi:carbonic anhydrase/acetyltransferase-like protein (isoleucine patch superfamily)